MCFVSVNRYDCGSPINMEIWRFQKTQIWIKRRFTRFSWVIVRGWTLADLSKRNKSSLAASLQNACFCCAFRIDTKRSCCFWRGNIFILYSVRHLYISYSSIILNSIFCIVCLSEDTSSTQLGGCEPILFFSLFPCLSSLVMIIVLMVHFWFKSRNIYTVGS